jgi:hypothetical protein
MRGRPRKMPDRVQGHYRPPRMTVSTSLAIARPVPPLPTGLSRTLAARWARWWRSPVARAVDWDRDGEAVERLFANYELQAKLRKSVKRRLFVDGSQGQPILNPAAKHLVAVEAAIRQDEMQFGRTPRAAAQLGVTIGDLQKTVEDLNRDASDDRDEDPRAQAAH